MKKMKYERPSMKVVVLSERSQLLAGSRHSAGFGGSWNDYGSGGSHDWQYEGGYGLGDGGDL